MPPLHRLAQRPVVAHVGDLGVHRPAGGLDLAHGLGQVLLGGEGIERVRQVVADVDADDAGALGREADRVRAALAPGHAGDEDDLALVAPTIGHLVQTRSMTVAEPMPPAAHMATAPHWASVRSSSLTMVTIMRAPVQPMG